MLKLNVLTTFHFIKLKMGCRQCVYTIAVVHVHLMNLNLYHKPSQTYPGHAVPI